MSELVTGDAYVAALSAEATDRIARGAFIELAQQLLPHRGRIFDFGCGPGLDARVYAERGFAVHAYDVDEDMCAAFGRHCADGLARGDIHLVTGSFESFLSASESSLPPFDLVTANFAPLNLVPDPAALFEKFHALLQPEGLLLLSVLNPLYRGDLRYAWWWRGFATLLFAGRYSVAGAQAPITRWLTARLAREAWPNFTLERVYIPQSPRARDVSSPRSWTAKWTTRFLFLQMRKLKARP